MRVLRSLEEANAVTAVRLTDKRRSAKVGDFFRLSPQIGIFLWGRLIKRAHFWGVKKDFNLIYIYDAISEMKPDRSLLVPSNLLIGPSVVNNLGWARGYWEIMESKPLEAGDMLSKHQFVRFRGAGGRDNYDVVDENGDFVTKSEAQAFPIAQSGFGNYNSVDWAIRGVLESRGVLKSECLEK
ncbi:Immunity protein 26 [Granulicella pectinivorans]|uniref:Immunity protein 26 n=1 Tax=Granulicella pectinivorans TaxID=474950 RepID=A0A1I6L697_9BACT|nr:Imm26 family immunity protein [Granulicella pectinivorans]SFR98967.1 Immunity protein 26 [Granulicella pectinivorans]